MHKHLSLQSSTPTYSHQLLRMNVITLETYWAIKNFHKMTSSWFNLFNIFAVWELDSVEGYSRYFLSPRLVSFVMVCSISASYLKRLIAVPYEWCFSFRLNFPCNTWVNPVPLSLWHSLLEDSGIIWDICWIIALLLKSEQFRCEFLFRVAESSNV